MLLLEETERIPVEPKKPSKWSSSNSSGSNVPLTEILTEIDEFDDPVKVTFLFHHLH